MASQPHKPSSAARYFFVFLIGLFAGVVGVVVSLRALDARKTWEDRFPTATMQVMSAHMAQLRSSVQANRCAASDFVPHVQTLRALANDLEPAFPGLREDQRYASHAGKMRATLDGVLSAPPLGCPGVQASLERINDSCGACHQDFRG
jgi:hypothetical protein